MWRARPYLYQALQRKFKLDFNGSFVQSAMREKKLLLIRSTQSGRPPGLKSKAGDGQHESFDRQLAQN
jgi:hypothetical protein